MKKIIGILAVVIAIGVSAFTSPGKARAFTSYKWFLISGTYGLSSPPKASDATYEGQGTTPPDEGCPDTNVHQCVSGFNANQVNGSNQLINDSQVPAVTPGTED